MKNKEVIGLIRRANKVFAPLQLGYITLVDVSVSKQSLTNFLTNQDPNAEFPSPVKMLKNNNLAIGNYDE